MPIYIRKLISPSGCQNDEHYLYYAMWTFLSAICNSTNSTISTLDFLNTNKIEINHIIDNKTINNNTLYSTILHSGALHSICQLGNLSCIYGAGIIRSGLGRWCVNETPMSVSYATCLFDRKYFIPVFGIMNMGISKSSADEGVDEMMCIHNIGHERNNSNEIYKKIYHIKSIGYGIGIMLGATTEIFIENNICKCFIRFGASLLRSYSFYKACKAGNDKYK